MLDAKKWLFGEEKEDGQKTVATFSHQIRKLQLALDFPRIPLGTKQKMGVVAMMTRAFCHAMSPPFRLSVVVSRNYVKTGCGPVRPIWRCQSNAGRSEFGVAFCASRCFWGHSKMP